MPMPTRARTSVTSRAVTPSPGALHDASRSSSPPGASGVMRELRPVEHRLALRPRSRSSVARPTSQSRRRPPPSASIRGRSSSGFVPSAARAPSICLGRAARASRPSSAAASPRSSPRAGCRAPGPASGRSRGEGRTGPSRARRRRGSSRGQRAAVAVAGSAGRAPSRSAPRRAAPGIVADRVGERRRRAPSAPWASAFIALARRAASSSVVISQRVRDHQRRPHVMPRVRLAARGQPVDRRHLGAGERGRESRRPARRAPRRSPSRHRSRGRRRAATRVGSRTASMSAAATWSTCPGCDLVHDARALGELQGRGAQGARRWSGARTAPRPVPSRISVESSSAPGRKTIVRSPSRQVKSRLAHLARARGGIRTRSPALQGRALPVELPGQFVILRPAYPPCLAI